jgi:hypothetical protein
VHLGRCAFACAGAGGCERHWPRTAGFRSSCAAALTRQGYELRADRAPDGARGTSGDSSRQRGRVQSEIEKEALL